MTGVVRINITETASELKKLLKQQKAAFALERVQGLYLLKTQQIETLQHKASGTGKKSSHAATVVTAIHRGWMK